MTWQIIEGDCVESMRGLADESVDSVVTDPPYELGFMGKSWDASGIANSVEMWTEVLRILKPGGHLLAFGGTRTYHRMVCAVEDAGFEIRDQLAWMFGSGFPKSHNLDGDYEGWGTALKPAHEPIVLARKPLTGTVAANVQEHGTGALNIDAARVEFASDNDLAAAAAAAAAAAQRLTRDQNANRTVYGDYNNGEASLEPYLANMQKGRWPANVVLDEAAADLLDKQSGESRSTKGKPRGTAKKGMFANSEFNAVGAEYDDIGGASRFFYCAKTSRAEREAGLNGFERKQGGMVSNTSGQHITRRDGGEPNPTTNNHPTVKPVDLMRWLIRLVTPPNGTVLDPFAGSGSTGCAATIEGFNFIGCEIQPEYVEIAEARIRWWSETPEGVEPIDRMRGERQRDEVAERGQLQLGDAA